MHPLRVLFAAILAVAAPLLPALHAADTPPAVQQVFDRLERSVDVDWKRTPLGEALADLAAAHHLTISLDPAAAGLATRPVTFHAAGTALGAVIDRVAGRFGLDVRIQASGILVLVPEPGAVPIPDWVEEAQPVRVYELGRYRRLPPPNGWGDPVAALGAQDADALAKPTAKTWEALLAGYIERIEAWHVAHSSPAAGLVAFLAAHPDVRRDFWPAIDPRFDDGAAACRIFDELRTATDEKTFLAHRHLAIAIAVVYDTPVAAQSSRFNFLWAVRPEQFGPTLDYRQIWDYFTDPRNQTRFVFKPKDLVWPMLVHLVDLDLAQDEIDWALAQYGQKKPDLQAFYQQVPYDYQKLAHTGTKLGDRPYTLQNLRQYGGVCVDQAHYASRIAKLFGVPSLKCGGNGRYGGVGHAWSGYLGVKGRDPQLLFTGRYQFDFYYVGTAFDPQTRTEVLDRDVELLYDGVSGRYQAHADAALLARGARALVDTKPELAAALAREAVRRDPCVAAAWITLLATDAVGGLAKSWENLAKVAAGHPDLICAGLRTALARLPTGIADAKGALDKPAKERQRLYEACYALCGAAKRPDLQIQVRLAQIGELADVKQDEQVIQCAFDTVRANVKEGTLIMPLVERVVTLANRFAVEDPRFKIGVVRETFAKLAPDFPKQRGEDVSPAWMEWQELMKTLK